MTTYRLIFSSMVKVSAKDDVPFLAVAPLHAPLASARITEGFGLVISSPQRR